MILNEVNDNKVKSSQCVCVAPWKYNETLNNLFTAISNVTLSYQLEYQGDTEIIANEKKTKIMRRKQNYQGSQEVIKLMPEIEH